MAPIRGALLASVLALSPALTRGAEPGIPSTWLPSSQPVDGGTAKWEGLLVPLGDAPITVGVRNDRDFLYLLVRTADADTRRQLLMTGLTVWANGAGKTKRGYGVRFPAGQRSAAPGDGTGDPAADAARSASELELIGPEEEDRLRLSLSQSDLVKAALDALEGILALELRIPLHPTEGHPLAIDAAPVATIALGFETEKPKRPGPEERGGPGGGMGGPGGMGGGMGGEGRSGGRGGPGGPGGGRGMRGGGAGRPAMPKPLKLWTRVTLAGEPPVAPRTSVPSRGHGR